jgi:hypothetical protein
VEVLVPSRVPSPVLENKGRASPNRRADRGVSILDPHGLPGAPGASVDLSGRSAAGVQAPRETPRHGLWIIDQ